MTTYSDIEVRTVRATQKPAAIVCEAASQTMFADPKQYGSTEQLIASLVSMNHHSVLEHASITFRITGCSRAFLAQITRQRTFKFTASSQHYQDYSNYPTVIKQDQPPEVTEMFVNALAASQNAYIQLLNKGVSKEEARMVLPSASVVNLYVTCDARNLMYFLVQRRCSRNVAEMIQVADAMWRKACDWFPELFNNVGPACVMTGKCNQGRMQASVCTRAYNQLTD